MNRIQFQRGLSLPEFIRCFGSEEQCLEAVVAARWPQGFRCPRCDAEEHYLVGGRARALYQCHACRYQASPIAGTLFEHTKLPLTTWFLGIFLISQAKTGISALSLKRQLGVSYPTAWLMQKKVHEAMAHREEAHRLEGDVLLDDAYLGGELAGGTPGRGSNNKVASVAAVSLSEDGRPLFTKLTTVAGFSRAAIASWAKTHLAVGANVHSDGLGCFAAVTEAGCLHFPTVVAGRLPRELPAFRWINTILGNLKTMLLGSLHSFKFRKYADGYLAAFSYRFNRRFDLRSLFARLLIDVSTTPPHTDRTIRGKTEHGCY